ncbi:MAG: lipopolysaccharide assembly protein LapA domain-containing protein [Candidatus Dormibacteraceae bacterium]
MPDLSHLWQRFLLASALIFGLLVGVASTVFGYSNTQSVDVRWSIFHIDTIPLWAVVLVPLAVALIAGTLYHWFNSLHHFTEHMRHRRRVHELEAEVATLREHLDHVLEMPDQSSSRLPAKHITAEPAEPVVVAPALPEPAAANGESTTHRRSPRHRRVTLTTASEPQLAVTTDQLDTARTPEAETAAQPGEAPAAATTAPAEET